MARPGTDVGTPFHGALIQRDTRPIDLVYAEVGDHTNPLVGPLRISNAGTFVRITGAASRDLDGTYIPQGGLISVDPIQEDSVLTVNELNVTLSGVTGNAINALLNFPYLNRVVKIWRGLLDEDNNLIGEPVLIFDGRIASASISDDPAEGTSTVSVGVSSQWSDFERRSGSKTNDNEQQALFSGDRGFQFAAESISNIRWGGE